MKRPKPPEHLGDTAKAKWHELLPLVVDHTQGTLDALACYCAAWSRMLDAEAKVVELGCVVKSPAGFPVQNPYLGIAQAERRALRQWGATLGLTSSASTKKKADTPLQLLATSRKRRA